MNKNVDHDTKWFKPSPGFLKINTDAAIKMPKLRAGGVLVVHDDMGSFIDAWSGNFRASSPLMAEAMVLRVTCMKAMKKNWRNVEF